MYRLHASDHAADGRRNYTQLSLSAVIEWMESITAAAHGKHAHQILPLGEAPLAPSEMALFPQADASSGLTLRR